MTDLMTKGFPQPLPADAIEGERERCASLAEDLAQRWEASAAKLREDHKTRFFWLGKPYVAPMAERDAKSIEAAANGLRAVARLIREGSTRR